MYAKEVDRAQGLMRKILECWKQVKKIRRETEMQTVPFRLNAKEYEVDGRKSFDFGVTASEINDKPTGNGAAAEIRRRE